MKFIDTSQYVDKKVISCKIQIHIYYLCIVTGIRSFLDEFCSLKVILLVIRPWFDFYFVYHIIRQYNMVQKFPIRNKRKEKTKAKKFYRITKEFSSLIGDHKADRNREINWSMSMKFMCAIGFLILIFCIYTQIFHISFK